MALLGSVGTAIYRSQIAQTLAASFPSTIVAAARESLEGAVGAARSVPAQMGAEVVTAARFASTDELLDGEWLFCDERSPTSG